MGGLSKAVTVGVWKGVPEMKVVGKGKVTRYNISEGHEPFRVRINGEELVEMGVQIPMHTHTHIHTHTHTHTQTYIYIYIYGNLKLILYKCIAYQIHLGHIYL